MSEKDINLFEPMQWKPKTNAWKGFDCGPYEIIEPYPEIKTAMHGAEWQVYCAIDGWTEFAKTIDEAKAAAEKHRQGLIEKLGGRLNNE